MWSSTYSDVTLTVEISCIQTSYRISYLDDDADYIFYVTVLTKSDQDVLSQILCPTASAWTREYKYILL